jgi:hypothetical protein
MAEDVAVPVHDGVVEELDPPILFIRLQVRALRRRWGRWAAM